MYVTKFVLSENGRITRAKVIHAEKREDWERRFRIMEHLYSHHLNRSDDPHAYVSMETTMTTQPDWVPAHV